MMQRPQTAIAISLLIFSLTACVPAAMFGGAAIGAYSASERRPISLQLSDTKLENLAARRLDENFGESIHVNANAFNGVLLLTGEIPTAELKQSFNELIKLTPNVKRVVDETKQIPLSETKWRLNDAAMTAKVKSRLASSEAFNISHVKVVTEGNDVFLMGKVSQKEADAAIDIARTTSAVNRVVNVFEIMTEEEWQKEMEAQAKARAEQEKTSASRPKI